MEWMNEFNNAADGPQIIWCSELRITNRLKITQVRRSVFLTFFKNWCRALCKIIAPKKTLGVLFAGF